MLLSVLVLIVLCAFTVRIKSSADKGCHFSLEKVLQLRGILTVLIILHHLVVCQGLTLIGTIHARILPHLGYLCVGVFLFISGYGVEYQRIIGKKIIY